MLRVEARPLPGHLRRRMNSVEAITGFVGDSSDVFHGYLRDADGTSTMFDVPGAGTGQFQGTAPLNINSTGVIAGYWTDASNVNHGFVRAPSMAPSLRSMPQAQALDPAKARQ